MKLAQLTIGRDDRCGIWEVGHRIVLAVADGSSGSRRGAQAADAVMRHVRDHHAELDAAELLRRCDAELDGSGGETTAVIAVVSDEGIAGASVGDSGAWLIEAGVDLTADQVRKPLIGSGRAWPTAFASGPFAGTLLLGSDGLFKYAGAARIREIASQSDLDAIPNRLVEAVRLRSGALQDDIAIVICRRPAPGRAL